MQKKIFALCFFILLAGLQPYYKQLLAELKRSVFPPQFGKTHFIVGMPALKPVEDEIVEQRPDSSCDFLCMSRGRVAHALFAPDDNVQEALIKLIDHEQKFIGIAIFSFTNKQIAQALIKAHERGVKILMVVDVSAAHDPFTKIDMLHDAGIQVCIYNQLNRKKLFPDRMHHKFVLFEKNILNKSLLWTGSFNFTRAAVIKNQENVIIVENEMLFERYKKQFMLLQTRSHSTYAKNDTH